MLFRRQSSRVRSSRRSEGSGLTSFLHDLQFSARGPNEAFDFRVVASLVGNSKSVTYFRNTYLDLKSGRSKVVSHAKSTLGTKRWRESEIKRHPALSTKVCNPPSLQTPNRNQ